MRHPSENLRQPPEGKLRVLGVDLSNNPFAIFVIDDFSHLDEANKCAQESAGASKPTYVYNGKGEVVMRYGSWD